MMETNEKKKSQQKNRRHRENAKGNLELKNRIIKIKMNGLKNKMQWIEKRVNQLEYIGIETTQFEPQRRIWTK